MAGPVPPQFGDDFAPNAVLALDPVLIRHRHLVHEAPDAAKQRLEALGVPYHGWKSAFLLARNALTPSPPSGP